MEREEAAAINNVLRRQKNLQRVVREGMEHFERILLGTGAEDSDFPVSAITLEKRVISMVAFGFALVAKGRLVSVNDKLVAEYMFTVTDDDSVHRVLGLYLNDDGEIADSPDFASVLGNINHYGPWRWNVALRIAQALLQSTVFAPSMPGVTPKG